jgi:hypothetical protein
VQPRTNVPLEIFEEVVVAGGASSRHRSRAAVQRLPNGELLVAYRVGWDMFQPDRDHGAVVTTRSIDGGNTWDEAMPVAAEPGWDWFGAQRLLQLSDGTLLMFLGKAQWGANAMHSYCVHSTDGGRLWSPLGPDIKLLRAWTEPYGQGMAHELSDGRLMMGFQGADSPDAPSRLIVAFSEDRGMTWSDPVDVASDPTLKFREVEMLKLANGRFLTVIRTDEAPYASYQCYSDDEGKTWSPLSKTGFHGHCLHLVRVKNAIVCLYREMAPNRPGIAYSVTYDHGESWQYGEQIYEAPAPYTGWAAACGYPSMVALDDDTLFCVFHTAFEAGNSDIRGLFLRDLT